MRCEAQEKFSDLAYDEALNDNVISLVVRSKVRKHNNFSEIPTSNALRYLLIDELEIYPKEKSYQINLVIEVPAKGEL